MFAWEFIVEAAGSAPSLSDAAHTAPDQLHFSGKNYF